MVVEQIAAGRVAEADVEQARDQLGPLQVDPGQQEPPAFAVAHGGVGGALEQVQVGDDLMQESHRPLVVDGLGRVAGDAQIEQVQPLPGFRGDLVAHLAGVLAGPGQGRHHRGGVFTVEHQGAHRFGGMLHHRQRIGAVLADGGKGDVGGLAGAVGAVHRRVQHHVGQAAEVLGPLDIAADPVEAVSDSREHHCG